MLSTTNKHRQHPHVGEFLRNSRTPSFGETRLRGFTLLEVVLAIALSATLLALIASSIGSLLDSTTEGRHRVEQAQLGRNLLRLMGEDLRNAAVYSPQDTSIAAQLAASAGTFDVDLITGGGSGSGSGGGTGGSGGMGTGGGSGGGGVSSSGSQSSGGDTTTQYQQPLGVYGNLNELQIDVLQPARPLPAPTADGDSALQDEFAGPQWRGGIRTVRYYYSPDAVVNDRFDSNNSLQGGLVREEFDRLQFDFASQLGTASSGTGHVLAPEVVGAQFRYSDGTQVLDEWNSELQQALPVAIEVRLWLRNRSEEPERSSDDLANAKSYVRIFPLWRSTIASGSGNLSGSSSSSSTGSNSGSSSGMGGGSSGSGSGSSGGSSSNF